MPKIIIKLLAAALTVCALLWGAVNLYIIPRKIIPQVRKYLDASLSGPVKVRIGDIYFSPFRGFILKDAEILFSRGGKEDLFLRAPDVDIDLRIQGLLWKRLEIRRFIVSGASIIISRDEKGFWNFMSLFGMDSGSRDTGSGGWKLLVDKVSVRRSSVAYSDLFKKNNSLRRTFTDVELTASRPRAEVYELSFSVNARSARKGPGESLDGFLEYDHASSSLKGQTRFKIRHLSEYRDYYLDDILKAWGLESDDISGQMRFDSKQGSLTIDAEYEIGAGVLRYGDFSVQADYSVGQELYYKNGCFDPDGSLARISLKNAVFRMGSKSFINEAQSALVIAKRALDIQSLTGKLWRRPVVMSGGFSFDDVRELSLSGRVDDFDTRLIFNFPAANQARADLFTGSGNSYFKLHAEISDLKDFVFALECRADIDCLELAKFLNLKKGSLAGRLTLSGNMTGEAEEPRSYAGGIAVGIAAFSYLGSQPVSCAIDAVIQEGVLLGQLPAVNFYGGELAGSFKLDYQRLGIEVHLKEMDIKKFSSGYERLKGLTGTLSGSAAGVSNWSGVKDLQGGGYINLVDCDLRLFPVVRATEEGLMGVIKNFVMPVFNEAEGNFQIDGKHITLQNVFCKATDLNLVVKGGYDLGGETNITVGATLFGGGLARTAKQVFRPFSLGVNLLANSFEVDIRGARSDLDHRVRVRPSRWLIDFLRMGSKADSGKYSLDKLW
ncbi:MAG: hypothetical protein PHR91_05525 [Candidatus Omnitrophica bacterium]|nr:hypothetical protein [Candidatus Omnitrophota bacterium]